MAQTSQELVFKLIADNTQLKRELAATERSGQKTAKSLEKSFSGFRRQLGGLVPAITVGSFAALGKSALDLGASIEDASKSTGFAIEKLQELRFAGQDAAGLGSSQVDSALQTFSSRIGQAAAGTGELKKELERYNIELLDSHGNTRTSESLLRDYADAIKGAANPQEQLRLTLQGFGKGAGAFVSVLKQGSAGLDEFGVHARDVGDVLDDKTVKSLAATNTAVEQLGSTLKKFIASKFGEALQESGLAPQTDADRLNLEGIGIQLNREKVKRTYDEIFEKRRQLESLRKSGSNGGFFGPSQQELTIEIAKLKVKANEYVAEIENAQGRIRAIAQRNAPRGASGPLPFNDELEKAAAKDREELQKFKETIREKVAEEERATAATIELAGLELDAQRRLREALAISEEAYLSTAQAIAAENAVRQAGLDLKSSEGQELYGLVAAKEAEVDAIKKLQKDSKESLTDIEKVGKRVSSTLSSEFADFAVGAELDFRRLAQSIASMFIESQLSQIFSGLGKSIFGGASLFGFAAGGRPTKPSIVGENGPEMFVPDVAGQIVPLKSASMGGGEVNVTVINNSGEAVKTSSQQTGPSRRDLQIMIGEAVNQNIRSGVHDGAFGKRFGSRPIGV